MDSLDIKQMESYLSDFIPAYKDKAGLFLCLLGTADIMVNYQIFHLERGGLYVISPLITIYKVSQSEDFDGIHILDDLEVFYSVIHSLVDTILRLKLRNSPCIRLSDQDIQFVMERKILIDSKREEWGKCDSKEEKTLVNNMIHLLEQETLLEVIRIYFRNRLVDSHPADKKETLVYNFIYSLHQNFKEQRSVSFYADEVHLSVGYFTAVVKGKTGRTPSDWIIAITMAQAKLLLEKTKKSVKEIAMELNFPEQFTFRKYFKQHEGMPPKEYRNRNKEGGKKLP